jgi:Tfp pilus assembly protein PilO
MDQFKNLPPQYKLLIGVGFLGFVAAAFYYLVIIDIDDQMAQLKGAYRTAQKELDGYKDFRGEIEIAELREAYAGVIKKIEENKKIIPDKELLPQLMSGLETDALDAGLVVVSKEQRPLEQEDFYRRIPIKFEVSGSYLDLVRFLKLISLPGKRLVNASVFDIRSVDTQKKGRGRKEEKDASPFSSSGRVATAESEISATFIISGFTYTGSSGSAGGKDKGKGKATKGKK